MLQHTSMCGLCSWQTGVLQSVWNAMPPRPTCDAACIIHCRPQVHPGPQCLPVLLQQQRSGRLTQDAGALHRADALLLGTCRYLMPSLQPYGGLGWTLACLLPPSCISLFASAIIKFETAQRGITWGSLAVPVTSEHPFSAATVFQMLLLDVVLYGVLTWYLDQVHSWWPVKRAQAPQKVFRSVPPRLGQQTFRPMGDSCRRALCLNSPHCKQLNASGPCLPCRSRAHTGTKVALYVPKLEWGLQGPCLHVQVWPSDVGQRQPWYFFVLPSYWSEGKPPGDPAVGTHKEAHGEQVHLQPRPGCAPGTCHTFCITVRPAAALRSLALLLCDCAGSSCRERPGAQPALPAAEGALASSGSLTGICACSRHQATF